MIEGQVISYYNVADPDWLYPYPDPQNLMNLDPDPGQYNHQIDFKSKKKLLIFKSEPKP